MRNFDTTFYFITDSSPYTEIEFLDRVDKALSGGATLLQLREKNRSTREYIDLAFKVKEIARARNVPLIVDDRVDVALAVECDGVHLGQSDMPVKTAREILGGGFVIGATTKTVEQAVEAYSQGADYCGVGAIYPTTTKVKTVLTSVETLSKICAAVPIPVNAIGGLNKDNLSVLEGTGISGICVVSAVMHADDPKAESETLSRLARELVSKK